jgi:hypothetical protein
MLNKRFPFLLILFFILSITYGQNRWTRIYHDDIDAIGTAFINSYDKGILFVGKHGSNSVNYNWLIKTDINGEILWEKTLGDPSTNIKISDMAYNQYGDLYLVGLTGYYNSADYDPMIMKLNACGEKQWCKVFIVDGINYSDAVVVLPDGSCTIILRYMGVDSQSDRICLAKFSLDGDMIWKQCYNSQDSNLHNEDAYDLIITTDGGFLITGVCYYVDPNPPHYLWLKPYFIKTNSEGIFEWETIVHKEISDIGGNAWNTVISPDSNCFYSAISHYYHFPSADAAALLKIDFNGNVIDIYDLATPSDYGKMTSIVFASDSTLAASAVWGNEWNALPPKAVIIDTLGNIINQKVLVDNNWMAHTNITFDDKLLFFTNKYEESSEQFDAYLFKLNQDLEDDTFYTFPFQYDSLCPYPIASDTIVQDDCDLIVGIEEEDEEMGRDGDEERMVLYPNPATDHINCRLQVADCRSSLLIYDMFGRKQGEIQIPKGQKEIQFDVSGYPDGIYIAILQSEREILDRKKFVVK